MIELGWPAMIIPETAGGLGMTYIELSMILGECGRTLAPSPLAGTLAGIWAVLGAGSPEQQARLLRPVVAGLRLALAVLDARGRFDAEAVRAHAGRLTGERHFVLDSAGADRLVVAAREPSGKDAFYVVERSASGVELSSATWRDVTRQVGRVRLDGAVGERLDGDAGPAWNWVRDRLYLMLATESAAGLHRVLTDTVAYAKERVAFGRPIGSYQAIKHSLAEMKASAECASAAVLYAAWALSEDHPRAPIAAAMAQAYASEAYRNAAFRSIQVFGAIGFTWEMPCHLYYKRARANAELFGNPAQQRAELMSMLEAGAVAKLAALVRS